MEPFANFSLHTLHAARPDFAASMANLGPARFFLVDDMGVWGYFHCWSGRGVEGGGEEGECETEQ